MPGIVVEPAPTSIAVLKNLIVSSILMMAMAMAEAPGMMI